MTARSLARPLAFVACIALAMTLRHAGYLDRFLAVEGWRAFSDEHRVTAEIGYVVMHTVLAGIGVPSILFLIPAPLMFPVHEAFAMGIVGSILGSQLAFELARGSLRTTLAARIPERLRRLDDRIEQNGFRTVVVLRLTLFLLPPVAWALGLTKVSARTYLVGTFVGMLPGVAFCNYVGAEFVAWLSRLALG